MKKDITNINTDYAYKIILLNCFFFFSIYNDALATVNTYTEDIIPKSEVLGFQV